MTHDEIIRELEPLAWMLRCVWAPLRFMGRHPTAIGVLILLAMTMIMTHASMQQPPHELAPLGADQ